MNRIISFTKNIGTEIEGLKKNFPLTSLLVIAASIWFSQVIVADGQYWNPEFTKAIIVFLILWGLGSFLVESSGVKNGLVRWVALIAAGGAALSMSEALSVTPFWTDAARVVSNGKLERLQISYGLILLALGLFNTFRKSGLRFSTYVLKSLQNFAQVGIVTWVFAVGSALVVYIFNFLILSSSQGDPSFRTLMLVMGIGLGLGFLFAVSDQKRSIASFTAAIVRWILLPLLTIAFVIVYAYIIKILLVSEIPSNQVYRILSGLFLLGLPVWLVIDHFPREELPVKVGTKLPIFFLPILVLQAYVIWIRISAYGLTPARYFGVMLVVFELVVILLYTFRRSKIAWMLPVFAAFVLVAGVIPGINMDDLSLADQNRQVQRFDPASFETLTAEERFRIISAYDYLNNNVEGKQLLTAFDDQSVSLLEKYRGETFIEGQDNYLYFSSPMIDIDISRYSKATMVFGNQYEQPLDLTQVNLDVEGNNEKITVDLSGMVALLLKNSAQNNHQVDQPLYLDLDDGSRLYFSYVNGEMGEGKQLKNFSFNGLLLTP